MNARPRIAALIPMRHHSERVVGKNYRSFAGRPLYHHVVETLTRCPEISEVVIDTDSPFLFEDAPRAFPSVRLLERPQHLRDGAISMNRVLLHTIEQVQADFYLQTHSTNPLLRPETVSRAIRRFLEAYPEYDSLFSVTRLQVRLWDSLTRPLNHNPAILLRTQDLLPVFEENSCLYLFGAQTLRSRQNRLGEHPLLFEIERDEALDIDDEVGFRVAEAVFLARRQLNGDSSR